jgi:uncharacterized protein
MHRHLWNLVLGIWCLGFGISSAAFAAEVLPPKPPAYFNDYAHVVSKEAALRFNEQLAQFERETSNQVLVAIWQSFPSQSSIEDFTQRAFQSWGVGGKANNGAVLFVFVNDHKMRIQPGYGLEGALPDITASEIIAHAIAPHFKANDYEGGLASGITAIFAAIRGEYQGTGDTVQQRQRAPASSGCGPLGFIVMLIVILMIIRLGRRRGGYGYTSLGGPFISSGWGSGGGWSGGSSSSSGGGFSGFTGGGGSSGGGGASGSW